MSSINGNPVSAPRGAAYWRSVEHLADTPEVRELISKEFPGYDVDQMVNGSRRGFLKLMGASMALAGLTLSGCRRWPQEKLAPYSTNPRDRVPGVPEQYATAMEIGGVASGLLVTSFDGRPIKIEGNPSHPFSWTVKDKLGSADAFAQASLLDMYDPHRSRTVLRGGKESSWLEFQAFVANHFGPIRGKGEGFAILSEATSGPSAADMKKRLLEAFPQARWYEYEAISRDNDREGSKLAFGKPIRSRLHLDKASHVVLLDCDALGTHPAHVRYAADWSQRRRSADDPQRQMNRVYVAESGFSISGAVADVRLALKPDRLYAIARGIAAKLQVSGVSGGENLSDAEAKFVDSAASDLQAAGSNAVLAAGGAMPPIGIALVHAINQKLGAVGNTVTLYEEPEPDRPTHLAAITELSARMKAGKVNTLLILGGNPAYDAPADLDFDKALAQVPVSIRLGLYEDETSLLSQWHLPRAHFLESWDDARAWDGTPGIVQPLIQPLYGGKSIIEVLAPITGDKLTEGYDIVSRTWSTLLPSDGFDLARRRVIEAGALPEKAFVPSDANVQTVEFPPAAPGEGKYVRFAPDSHVYDGRFANNGWLQETPDPLTKLMWDNAALIAKQDADSLGITTGDMLHVQLGERGIEIAAYVLPGQPVGVITLPLGYGREAAGHIGDRLGFDTYLVRTTKAFDLGAATVRKSDGSYKLVSSQDHHIIDAIGVAGRQKRVGEKEHSGMLIHEATLAQLKQDPQAANLGAPRKFGLQLFEEPRKDHYRDTHAWGMTVDLNSCIGCNACTVACQAENNIPIVGKSEADNHRAMNWIRIDRYFKGDASDPSIEVVYQPMMCQQCENAPCEQVCPVGATVHDSEGLNTMVYNRCIGTRYCSNNCPYKVRRFNYLDYHTQDPRAVWGRPFPNLPDQQDELIDKIKRMVFNPEVTVRMRGVMEKCTYCVQRIHHATIARRARGQDVVDGDIVTACQEACPTQAIVFGNLNDPDARVSRLQSNPRAYSVLDEELDTRPRTRYLAKLRNPSDGPGRQEA